MMGPIMNIVSYDLQVDLTGTADTFTSRTEIRFRAQPGSTGDADLRAASIRLAELNGAALDTRTCQAGRLNLRHLAAENTLIVEAEFGYVTAGAGLLRQTGSGDEVCIYSKAYPGGAPRIYCCFDQPGLRAPFKLSANVPAGWSCLANGPVTARPAPGKAGRWTFGVTPPIAPYLFSLCAGPFSGPALTARGDRTVPFTASALPHLASALQAAVSPGMFSGPLDFYEHSLGTPCPYGKYDIAFVPGYPGLAFGAPGLVTITEKVLTQPHGGPTGLYLAVVIAHELAHAWFGGLTEFQPPSAGWLEEAITTYLSRTAIEETRPGATPWAAPVSRALPDDAYARNADTIRQLEHLIGRHAVLAGLGDLLNRHAYGDATQDDLIQCWSRAARRDLHQWAATTLRPANDHGN
jgi:aminopeptidase N